MSNPMKRKKLQRLEIDKKTLQQEKVIVVVEPVKNVQEEEVKIEEQIQDVKLVEEEKNNDQKDLFKNSKKKKSLHEE